jgi:hypothetical protein
MKKSALFIAIFIGAVSPVNAGPCISTTLTNYIALGSGGCSIGTDTFFGFGELVGQFGAVQIAPGSILITPSGGSLNPTLEFSTILTVNFPAFDEALINYHVGGNTYLTETTTLGGTSPSNGADATSVQNYCPNGTFSTNGVTGCPGDPSGTHNVLVNFGNSASPVTFPSHTSTLSITDDFVLDASGGGSITGGTLTDSFTATPSAVPEPETCLLVGLGIAGGIVCKIKQSRNLRVPEGKNEY